MKRSTKIFTQVTFATVGQLFIATSVMAMCVAFWPPGRSVTPADNTKTLIVYENGRQHTIVQPEFNGNLEDFALVMPAANEPTVSPVSDSLFDQLEDFTNPVQDRGRGGGFGISAGLEQSVPSDSAAPSFRVVSRQDVGSYTATILQAQDLTLLRDWLNDNGYEGNSTTEEILEYYIQENAYFVALKVNTSRATGSTAKVEPIDISFETDAPTVPTRLLSGTPETLSYVVYVLAPEPYVIPGGDVQYSKKLGLGDVLWDSKGRSLLPYNGTGQWLVRSTISVDPELVKADTPLLRIADAGTSQVQVNDPRRAVNVGEYIKDSGIVSFCNINEKTYLKGGELTFFDEFYRATSPRLNYRQNPQLQLGESSWNDYSYLQYKNAGIDDTGPYITEQKRDFVPVDECDDTAPHTFDLAVGDAKLNGGPPLLAALKILGFTAVFAFVAWRAWLVKKHGMRRLLPNPFRTVRRGTQWVEHKTGHRVFTRSAQLSVAAQGYRNIVVLALATSLVQFIGQWYADVRLPGAADVVLSIASLVMYAILFVFILIIKPTAIQVRSGTRKMFRYLFSIVVGVAICVVLVLGFVNIR